MQDIKNYIAPSRVICKSSAGAINNPLDTRRQRATDVLANYKRSVFLTREAVRATVVVLMQLMGDSMLISQIN